MLFPPERPGQRCRVVGGRLNANDEGKGPNIGKVVVTVEMRGLAGVEQEPVWRCNAAPGEQLVTYHGAVAPEADFLACWLEVLPEDRPQPPELRAARDLEKPVGA